MTKEEKAIDTLFYFKMHFAKSDICREHFDMAIKALELQPKIGHWICHRDHCENLGVIPSGLGVYEWCSNCDCGIDIRDWQRNPHDFCPNCGADMRESEGKE